MTTIETHDGLVWLQFEGYAYSFHPLLLRDACTCSECRNPATNERLLQIGSVDPDLQVSSVELLPGSDQPGDLGAAGVVFSDGHRTRHELSWLIDHARSISHSLAPAAACQLWRSRSERGITVMPWAALVNDASSLIHWLDALAARGVAIVSDVPVDDDAQASLLRLADRLGPIQPTNYGPVWGIEATIDHVSQVESQHALAVHTDLPYRDLAPGIQLLLSVEADVAGGASTLVDGYAVAETIRDADPTAWQLLTSIDLTYPYIRDNVEHHGRAPLIGLRPDGRYHQIRRAPDLVGVPLASAEQTPAFYRALALWNALVDDPSFEIQIRLEPGQLLAFDNHRVLHGRTAFDLGAAGRRRLIGCYLDTVDVQSTRQVLARRS